MQTLKSLQVLIIDVCNYACAMCNIWQNKRANMLEVRDLSRLPHGLEFLSINGGETTLHPRLPGIVSYVHDILQPKMLLLCSNGSNPRRLAQAIELFEDVAVSLSFDGLQSHDKIRGKRGALNTLMQSMNTLHDHPGRKILSFTCLDTNKREIREAFEFATTFGWEFDFRLVDQNELYGKSPLEIDDHLLEDLRWLQENEPDGAKKLFYQGYFEKPVFDCQAGKRFAYLLPDKQFYACLSRKEPIGNLETGITKPTECSCGCWVDCYFYDNFHDKLGDVNCIDTKHKKGELDAPFNPNFR